MSEKVSTLLQNYQIDYFHPVSKSDLGLEQLKYYKAKQLKLSQIFY